MERDLENKDRRAEEQTPIMDGDTRPDQIVGDVDHAKQPSKEKKKAVKKDEITSNRAGDVNSLEDFKDS